MEHAVPRERNESELSGRQPLAPRSLLVGVFFVAFAVPNLIFSGGYFFSSLHLMKWAAVFLPLSLLAALAGYRIARYGTLATNFRIDGFAVIWLAMLLYVTVQPLWAGIRSIETFQQEWFFFAFLWVLYVLAAQLADRNLLLALLWGSLLNAVVNVLFAELQIRGLHEPFFFVYPTPTQHMLEYYLGNTGQQNMFALWMAIGALNGSFLFLRSERGTLRCAALASLPVVFWGLIESTSRSGILSFVLGFAVLSLFLLRLEGKNRLKAILFIAGLFIAVAGLNFSSGLRSWKMAEKLEHMIEEPASVARRDTCWATTWVMFAQQPVKGVGLGQYKWNYLHAQSEMVKRWPHLEWQYTQWAHNEYFQWFTETGIAGGFLMLFLWGWWGWSAASAFRRKKPLSPEAFWGNAMISLISFNAFWTRPFHRIENVVWLILAFALANRETLRPLFPLPSPERFEKGGRLLAASICLGSLLGILYFGNGIWGDRMLRLAARAPTDDFATQKFYLEKASTSPMMRDTVERLFAYHSIYQGNAEQDPDLIAKGLGDLLLYFEKQPHIEELSFLYGWSRRLNNKPLQEYIDAFGFRPKLQYPVSGEEHPGAASE